MSSHEIEELITAAICVAPFAICAIWLGLMLLRDEKVVE